MGERVPVWVEATDAVTSFGVRAQLRESGSLELVDAGAIGADTVVVLAVDEIDDEVLRRARELSRLGCTRHILVSSVVDDEQLQAAVEIGICAAIERRDTTPAKLEHLVQMVVRGESELPTIMLSRLMRQLAGHGRGQLATRTPPFLGLTAREAEILRLVAEGLDTDEIAGQLAYSARTVKNILHAVTTRFCLRNRSHAVAYALREGLI